VNVAAETSELLLRLPARPEYLMFSRLVLTGLSRAIEIDPETLADLKLAVSEACSYAIRSGEEDSGTIAVRYELRRNELAVDVEAELTAGTALQDPDALAEAELGFAIIAALVDGLRVEHGPEGQVSRVSFSKTL
jgi:serine/threonine-protein kinase RsbW